MTRWFVTVAILTVGMGTAVAVSWFTFASRIQSFGLDPASILTPHRLMTYASQYLLVAGLTYWVVARRRGSTGPGHLAAFVAAAWLGEGLVLTLIGEPLVANELDPTIAWYFWLVATGGPMQPVAAFAGGLLSLHRGSDT